MPRRLRPVLLGGLLGLEVWLLVTGAYRLFLSPFLAVLSALAAAILLILFGHELLFWTEDGPSPHQWRAKDLFGLGLYAVFFVFVSLPSGSLEPSYGIRQGTVQMPAPEPPAGRPKKRMESASPSPERPSQPAVATPTQAAAADGTTVPPPSASQTLAEPSPPATAPEVRPSGTEYRMNLFEIYLQYVELFRPGSPRGRPKSFLTPEEFREAELVVRGMATLEDPLLGEDEILLGRYVVTCCLADARFFGTIVRLPPSVPKASIREGGWYELRGRFILLEAYHPSQIPYGLAADSLRPLDPRQQDPYIMRFSYRPPFHY